MWREKAILFSCEGEALSGILHTAENPDGRGLLMIVGGPQYRVGSHRQSVQFAREMAASGTSVLRFDHRGIGDSSGPYLDFKQIEKDLSAALDELVNQLPDTRQICVFGLCDAASSALMFSSYDDRVTELILLNPWVRKDAKETKAGKKHYLNNAFLSAEFWRKLFDGNENVFAPIGDAIRKLRRSRTSAGNASGSSDSAPESKHFRKRMRMGAEQFKGRVLLVLSGNELEANEFDEVVSASRKWTQCISNWTQVRIASASHTFARSDWKAEVVKYSRDWMNEA